MKPNLYELPAEGLEFTAPCGGNLGGSNETCVEFAALPGTDGYVLRDNKPEGAGQQLRFDTAELDQFATAWVAQRGLTA